MDFSESWLDVHVLYVNPDKIVSKKDEGCALLRECTRECLADAYKMSFNLISMHCPSECGKWGNNVA